MVFTPERPLTEQNPLSQDELYKTHAYWRACNYLARHPRNPRFYP